MEYKRKKENVFTIQFHIFRHMKRVVDSFSFSLTQKQDHFRPF